MKACSLFLKLLKNNLTLLITYICVFVLILTMSFNGNEDTQAVSFKPDILLINNDTDNEITRGVIEYIKIHSTVHTEVDGNQEEAMFYGDIVAIVTIPEGFGEAFTTNNSINIITKCGTMANGYTFINILNGFISTAKTYYDNDIFAHDNFMNQMISLYTENEDSFSNTIASDDSQLISMSFNFIAYVMLAGVAAVIAFIMASLKPTDVRRRLDISGETTTKRNVILLLCNFLLGLVVFGVCVIINLILISDYNVPHKGLMILNGFFAMMVATTFGYFLSIILSSKLAISAWTTIISLGLAFITGMFVSQKYLNKTVYHIGQIFPTHWYVRFNDFIASGTHTNSEILKEALMSFGIQSIFIVGFVVLSLFFAHKNKTKEA